MKSVSLFVFATVATLGLAACESQDVAPPAPEPASGPIDAPGSLNGTYNLRASDCTTMAEPETRLIIEGNKFNFYDSACTVANSETENTKTTVSLSCAGGTTETNRVVSLQSRPGELRITEGQLTYTYFQCEA